MHAEAFSAAELRHGRWRWPGDISRSCCSASSDERLRGVADLVAKLTAQGVPVIVAGAARARRASMLPAVEACIPSLRRCPDPELLSARRCPALAPRTQPGPSAPPEQGDGDP